MTNQRGQMIPVINLIFFSTNFFAYILDEAVTMTGYISHWNPNRRAIPNQIGTNFFQYKLSSFTANLLSVSCASLRYSSQHFYICPSMHHIKLFINSSILSFLYFYDDQWMKCQFFLFISTLFHWKNINKKNSIFFLQFISVMYLSNLWKVLDNLS